MPKTKKVSDTAYVIGDDFMTNPTIEAIDVLSNMQSEISFYGDVLNAFSQCEESTVQDNSLYFLSDRMFNLVKTIDKTMSHLGINDEKLPK